MTRTVEHAWPQMLHDGPDIVSADQFTRQYVDGIVVDADYIEGQLGSPEGERELAGTWPTGTLVNVSYEKSTRTSCSLQRAAHILGLSVINIANAKDELKDEPAADAAIMLGAQGHVLAIRHPDSEYVANAASVIGEYYGDGWKRPVVINNGSGERDHPTQALVDASAMFREYDGQLDGLHTVMYGGFNNRTIRSHLQMRSLYEANRYTFVAPRDEPELAVPADILRMMDELNLPYEVTDDFEGALREADMVYAGRIKNERRDQEPLQPPFVIGDREMRLLQPHARVFHALPREGEIDRPADRHIAKAAYMRQAVGAKTVRAAMLSAVNDARLAAYEQMRQPGSAAMKLTA